jgi:hypothetical protein
MRPPTQSNRLAAAIGEALEGASFAETALSIYNRYSPIFFVEKIEINQLIGQSNFFRITTNFHVGNSHLYSA